MAEEVVKPFLRLRAMVDGGGKVVAVECEALVDIGVEVRYAGVALSFTPPKEAATQATTAQKTAADMPSDETQAEAKPSAVTNKSPTTGQLAAAKRQSASPSWLTVRLLWP